MFPPFQAIPLSIVLTELDYTFHQLSPEFFRTDTIPQLSLKHIVIKTSAVFSKASFFDD